METVLLDDDDRKEHDVLVLGVNAVRTVVNVASTRQSTVSTFRVIMVYIWGGKQNLYTILIDGNEI